ncbi:DUF6300 family protein [Streptomyces sp. NPDC005969]|uniref:DUF6300 family protein n=1 Tax=Streptomyces sp. NPDC005969 TaxID=3156722 RepID=UPI0033D6B690
MLPHQHRPHQPDKGVTPLSGTDAEQGAPRPGRARGPLVPTVHQAVEDHRGETGARKSSAVCSGRPCTGRPAPHLQPVSADTSAGKVLADAHVKVVHSIREAVLCPVCDRGEPASDRLLALFLLHEALVLSELETFHVLVTAWVAVARGRQADQHQLDDEFQRWRNGEL